MNTELSEKKVALVGTPTFNKVMGFINVALSLVLAVCLTLLAVTETHNRKDAAMTNRPYCKCFSAAPS